MAAIPVAIALPKSAPVYESTLSVAAPATDQRDSLDIRLYARILKSADQRVLDSALINTAMQSSNAEVRRVAARTVSQVALRHRRRAIPMLRALVHDADSSVAAAAVFGLGLVRDTASVDLLASLFRANDAASAPAAWSLGEIGAPAADTVTELLKENQLSLHASRTGSHNALRELLIAASKQRGVNFIAIEPYLASPDPELRWAVAYAVARNHSPAGALALLGARSPDAAFRAELARELTSATVGDSLRERAIARLHLLVRDSSPYVRINAIRSMATFGTLARSVILHALRDHDENVRVAAAQSAATAFSTTHSAWRGAWSADTSYKVRKSLIETSSTVGIHLPGVDEWRSSSDWRYRAAAVAALGSARDTLRARRVALEATRDSDGRVRAAAYEVLARSDTARRDASVQDALLAARSDPDSVVRNSIPGARARQLDTSAVERPIEWYDDAVRRVVVPSLRGHPLRAVMRTARGEITITLDGRVAPLTVLNYATLSDAHSYDNLRFHRVVPGFVAQDGDPRGDGEGGPGYAIRDELTLLPYRRGAVGMALSGPDTGGSQYFLTLTPQPHLTGHYTVFGQVTSGLNVMDALVEGDAIRSVAVRW